MSNSDREDTIHTLLLLEGILKLAIHQGLVRADLTLEEFDGPTALLCLSDMLKIPQRIKYESSSS